MNSVKEKFVPQRNITPNFIRFKRRCDVRQVKTVMASPQPPSKTIEMTPSIRNVAKTREVDAASKSTRKEYSISAN